MRRLVVFICWIVLPFATLAQRNYTMYNLKSLPQSHYFNASSRGDNKLYISIPLGMQSFGFMNTGFTFNQAVVEGSDDSLYISPTEIIDKLKPLNYAEFTLQNELLGLSFGTKNQYFSFSAIARSNMLWTYPKDFIVLLFEGNGESLLGKRADMNGLGLTLNTYYEYGFGYNIRLLNRITTGARLKILNGIANVSTRKSQLGLTTNEDDYSLTFDGALDLRTSGIVPILQGESTLLQRAGSPLGMNNPGMAIDLGTTVKLSDKLTISAAFNDMGFIRWKEEVFNYRKDELNYTFEGIDIRQSIRDSTYFEKLGDTLAEILELEKDNEAYTQKLPMRMVTGARYQLTKQIQGYATLFGDFNNTKYRPTILLGGSFSLKNWFRVNMHYMATTHSYGNLGLGLYLRGAGIQYFVVTDNIIGALNWSGSKNFHVSTGLALTFGKPKEEDSRSL